MMMTMKVKKNKIYLIVILVILLLHIINTNYPSLYIIIYLLIYIKCFYLIHINRLFFISFIIDLYKFVFIHDFPTRRNLISN